jgi:hypothetical protein
MAATSLFGGLAWEMFGWRGGTCNQMASHPCRPCRITSIGKLLEENAQLRKLVIQLTKIAIKNIMEPARQVN